MSGKYFDYPKAGLFKNNFNIKVIFLISDALGCDLNLKVVVWALRPGFEPQGWDLSLEAGI